ncbi:hypothetical protein D5S18_25365 [Nocardia panacis]|uniref:Uncharacterized protein n=1 Tax=Nocardia panacis TaxID=2340916 RepID=A0A3A4JWV2_9NOCA|nr:hypothetical protein D5S18_25365 [Nocardia panacis]
MRAHDCDARTPPLRVIIPARAAADKCSVARLAPGRRRGWDLPSMEFAGYPLVTWPPDSCPAADGS